MRPELIANWGRLSPLLDEALDRDPEARAAWLDALAPEHADLKPMLAELLASRTETAGAGVLATLPRYGAGDDGRDGGPARSPGERIAGYRLVREIGRGGMGTVWLAEPADGFAKLPVALKLPRIEDAPGPLRERFERERAILATLNHPRIARLHEAGVTADGQPYLAIEYVEGGTLVEHCDASAPSLRERLALFAQVLEAVHYAHANLVIHRDLKPSNILVTATGDVKLLDFGIAKLLDAGSSRTADTGLTQRAGHVMTPDYASPEQVAGAPLTTASDVYSLGVVLFELLAGVRPYRLKRGSRAELEEAILTADTSRPSTVATGEIAARAREPTSRWRRHLKGDLDTIVLKALARRAADRYPGADAFRADIVHFLAGEPILARPESEWYRARKFVTRHKLAAGAAAAVLASLVAGLSASLWQAELARQEAAKAKAVQGFLTDLFEKNTRFQADAARSRSRTVRELLVEAGDRVPGAFRESPVLKAELSLTVARLLVDVDEFERANRLFAEAASLSKAAGAAQGDARVESLLGIATTARLLGRAPEALAARDEALAILDERREGDTLLRARASASSVAHLSRDPEHELALVERSLSIYERNFPAHPERFGAILVAAQLHRVRSQWSEARKRFLEALSVFEPTGSRDFAGRAAAWAWAGFCAARLGLVKQGIAELETGIRELTTSAGENALVTRFHRGHHAELLHRNGRLADAHREFDALRRSAPPEAPTVVDFDNAIYEADGLLQEGRNREAERLLASFAPVHVEMGKRFYPNGVRWATLLSLARALQGRHAAADEALARIGTIPRQYPLPPEKLIDYRIDVARVLRARGSGEEAWRVLTGGSGAIGADPGHFSVGYANLALAAIDLALDRKDLPIAKLHLQQLRAHIDAYGRPGENPWVEADARRAEGRVLLAAGDARAAAASLRQAVGAMERLQDPASADLAATRSALAEANKAAR